MRKYKWQWYLISVLLLLLLRAPIFRLCVRYECSQEIAISPIQRSELKSAIRQAAKQLPNDDIDALIRYSQSFTARYLRFRTSVNSSLPDDAWASGEAHCVGYAALMGAVLQELIGLKAEHLVSAPVVNQCRGNIYLFGLRLTGPDRPAFFRDHDYVQVHYPLEGVTVSYDPSVFDYLRIGKVNGED